VRDRAENDIGLRPASAALAFVAATFCGRCLAKAVARCRTGLARLEDSSLDIIAGPSAGDEVVAAAVCSSKGRYQADVGGNPRFTALVNCWLAHIGSVMSHASSALPATLSILSRLPSLRVEPHPSLDLVLARQHPPFDMASPPADFKHLAAAKSAEIGTFVNVIGVVVDLLPTRQTQTGDYMLTFKLLDPKLRDAIYGNDGFKVRFFRKVAADLPAVQVADVVMLRSIKVGNFANETILLSHLSTAHLVFPDSGIPKPGFSIGYMGGTKLQCAGTHGLRERLTPEEQSYIIQVKDQMQVEPKAAPAPAPGAAQDFSTRAMQTSVGRQKLKTIKELRHDVYSDLCVQVVKKFPTPHGGHFGCELYVTDYTENDQMFYYRAPEEPTDAWRDGDSFGYNQPSRKDWPGPYGFLVLKIELAHPHAGFALSKVAEGDVLLLQNVRPKLSGGNSRLEANMWTDSINPEKVQIQKIPPQQHDGRREVLSLLQRRAQYWAGRERLALQQKQVESAAKPTKGEKKKKRKLAKQQAEAEAALVADGKSVSNLTSIVICI